MSNTKKACGRSSKTKKKAELTLLIVSWSTGTDLSQRTKAFTSGLESFCVATSPSIIQQRLQAFRLARANCAHTVSCGVNVTHNENTYRVSAGKLNNHYPNWRVKLEHIRWGSTPVTRTSQAEIQSLKLRRGGDWLVSSVRKRWWESLSVLIIQKRAWSLDAILLMLQLVRLIIGLSAELLPTLRWWLTPHVILL